MRPDEFMKIADQWMDDALSDLGRPPVPRGLEDRVLRRIGKEETHSNAWRMWVPAFGFGIALIVALVGLLMIRPHTANIATIQTNRTHVPTNLETKHDSQSASKPASRTIHPSALRTGRLVGQEVPKLEQFPRPQPLSPQEEELARYVSEHQEHAVLLARAQTALLSAQIPNTGPPYSQGGVQPKSENIP